MTHQEQIDPGYNVERLPNWRERVEALAVRMGLTDPGAYPNRGRALVQADGDPELFAAFVDAARRMLIDDFTALAERRERPPIAQYVTINQHGSHSSAAVGHGASASVAHHVDARGFLEMVGPVGPWVYSRRSKPTRVVRVGVDQGGPVGPVGREHDAGAVGAGGSGVA